MGMDQASKEKRDLFIQGLSLRWQEKVVPSASTFADALHKARVVEEHDRQLAEIHKGRMDRGDKSFLKKAVKPTLKAVTPSDSPPKVQQGRGCFKCGSLRHRAYACPQRKPPTETPGKAAPAPSNQVTGAELLDQRCAQLQAELAEVEHRRMLGDYGGNVGVDTVTGALGPTYYAKVSIEGTLVNSMVDPGSSATILSYEKFVEIGKKAGISVSQLARPDTTLIPVERQDSDYFSLCPISALSW